MEPHTLKPNDRIIFGTSSVFLFRNQARDDEAIIKDSADFPIDYEFAMSEKTHAENAEQEARRDAERKRLEEESAAKLEALKQ